MSATTALLLPLIAGLTMLFYPDKLAYRKPTAAFFLFLQVVVAGYFAASTYQGVIFVSMAGGWLAPYGIAIVIDLLSAGILLASNIVFFATSIYGFSEKNRKHYLRLPLIFFLQTGVSLSLITGDFFNLFVAFEVMLTASYSLMTLDSKKSEQRYVYNYILMNSVGSFLFLCAAALVYGYTGSLNMAALSQQLEGSGNEPVVLAIAVFALIVFGLKAGVFPFYFWLPDSYPTLPSSLAGMYGGVLTKVGVYILIRFFVTILPHNLPWIYDAALVLAGFTMFLGVLGAVSRNTIKGILSYHIVSQVGYIIMALGFFTPSAIAAGLLFTVHNMIVKSSLFLFGGIAESTSKKEQINKMGSLWGVIPLAGTLFLVQAFSLAGIPPLSGFWGKYLLLFEALREEHYFLVIIAVITSFLTLFSMIKIWFYVFWGLEKEKITRRAPSYVNFVMSGSVLVGAALFLGITAEYSVDYAQKTSEQIFTKSAYTQAVLGTPGKGDPS